MNLKSTFRFLFIVVIITLQFTTVTMGQVKNTDKYLTVGDLKVHMLQDARMYLPISTLSGIDRDTAVKLVGGSDSAFTPANAFLVQTKNHLVLVDAGIGKYPGEDSGHLLEYLKDAGIDPSKIDLILITHFHFDHIGGLISSEGKRVFPNAIIRASQAESDFWMRDSSLVPENMRTRAAKIKAIFAPYYSANAYLPFLPGEDLGDSIRALPANGHTPGHTVYSFSSKGHELWCIGDLIHFGSIQFKHPLVGISFDSNHQMAIDTRIVFFQRAARDHIIIAGVHLPEMVQLTKNGDGFVAMPVDIR